MASVAPSSPASDREQVAEPVLAVVDLTFLVGVPLLLVTVMIGVPDAIGIWVAAAVLTLGASLTLALRGRRGRALRRGGVYTVVTLAAAVLALWTIGPITGVGALFGLAVVYAGAFLPSRGLLAVLACAAVAIVIRAVWPTRHDVPIDDALWIGTSSATAILLWMTARMFGALLDSLSASHAAAEEALRVECTTREQLVTSRAELEELAQVELVGRLAAGVAHDVNNALAVVFSASDVLASELTTPQQRRDLAELDAASFYTADLIRDLLWIGRKFPASRTATARLGAVVRASHERLGRIAREVRFEPHVDADVWVACGPEQLEQILIGLVMNARRTGARCVTLRSEPIGEDGVELVLCEDATDVAPATRAMQVQLGLSAAREQVAGCGGTLQAGPDGIRLRLRMTSSRRSLNGMAALALRSALVVEDEPMVLRRLCQLIARRGYQVTGATTVAEGLAGLAAGPDLLVTDLQLPDGSGERIVRRSFAEAPARPIVVCSGFGEHEILTDQLSGAKLKFLHKPFTAQQLAAAIPNASQDDL